MSNVLLLGPEKRLIFLFFTGSSGFSNSEILAI